MTSNSTRHWKIASIFIILLTALITNINSASAQTCTTNCLSVYSIELTDLGNSIRGIVKLIDEEGTAGGARSAVVHAVWTRPDGSSFDQYDVIGTRLRAEFSLYTAGVPGTYTLTVAGASKTGYTFDPNSSSILSKSITVGSTTNQLPVAVANADFLSGSAPLAVNFTSEGSNDPDGIITAYSWDFGDGTKSDIANPSHAYNNIGNFTATLTVTDDKGAKSSSSVSITVTDSNTGCISNCMSVDRISMSYKARTGRVKGLVYIHDENDNAISRAVVHAIWTLPDGSTVDQYKTINKRNLAKFILKARTSGQYTLTIVEITKESYTFDPDSSNVLSGTIEITQ